MSQPTYSNANGYISEQFFTLFFDINLDAANPPAISAFDVQINGTGTTVSAVEVDSTGKSVKITFTANALTAGDIIEFSYQDPTGGNDVNAVQGLDGTDTVTFFSSTIVFGGRPGPSAPPVPTLDSGSDSATLGDHITSDNTPMLSGTSEANATVKLYDTDGTTLLGTTTADGSGNWSITSSQLSDASHTLKVTQTNSLSQTSTLSTGLTLTIDTVVNAPTTLAVAAGSDSGTLGDGISNASTPIITGVSEANAAVRLYDTDGTTLLGTATANGSGHWSITSSSLVTGVHTLTAKQTDTAGNVSSASSGFAYMVDTIGPIGMALSTNSVPVASATNGSTIATLSSTDITSVSYGFAVGNGTIDADNGKFTISGGSLTAAQTLSVGAYHIYLNATDAAGNEAFQIFVINVTNAPSVDSIVRAGGASATVQSSATSVDYTVTFSDGVTGVDANDFTLTPSSTASGTIASVSGSGSTYTVTVNTISGDGTLRLDLNASGTGIQNGSSVDITGGGYVLGETYSLDHTAPTASSTPAMTTGTDTGSSSSDANTSNTTPVFTGTGEANATIKLYDTDGITLLGSTTADGSGNWSITSSSLSEGAHSLTTKVTDSAGNVSVASSALAVTIATTTPTFDAIHSSPVDNATSLAIADNITVHFSEALSSATNLSKIYLKDVATDTLVPSVITLDGSGHVVINPDASLSYASAYYVSWDAGALTDAAGNSVASSSGNTTYNFSTVAAPEPEPEPDPTPAPTTGPDTDGVPDTVENAAPGLPPVGGGAAVAGDGNGDGVSDSQQSSVTSVAFLNTTTAVSNPASATPVYVSLVADSVNGKVDTTKPTAATLTNVHQLDAPANLPSEIKMPLGLISFSATVGLSGTAGVGVGESFSLYVDPSVGVNGYWKINTAGTWVNLASEAYGGQLVTEGGKTRLDFKIVDGGEFDADHTVNGTIADPGAAGSMPLSLVGYAPELASGTHFWF